MHFYEILGQDIADYEKERRRLEYLFQGNSICIDTGWGRINKTSLMSLSEKSFKGSPVRGSFIDISDLLNSCSGYWEKPSLEGLLLYSEILLNLLECRAEEDYFECSTYIKEQKALIIQNIYRILEKTGHEIRINEDKIVFITKKDALAFDVVKELTEKDIALAIIEYNRVDLSGDLDKKRELLNIMGRKAEPIIKDSFYKSRFQDLVSDVGFGLNNLNIRHNNLEGSNQKDFVQSMPAKELEMLYDDLYVGMLILIRIDLYYQTRDSFQKLKERLKNGG